MRGIRTIAVAVFAAGMAALAASPATAAPKEDVNPILECVFVNDDGSYIAVWGYENKTAAPVVVPIGVSNKFDPKPEDQGQPTTFEVGRKSNVVTTESDGRATVWKLPGGSATANKNSKACEQPHVPQGNDSPQAFVLIAAIAGGIAIVGGASGFALRRRRRTA